KLRGDFSNLRHSCRADRVTTTQNSAPRIYFNAAVSTNFAAIFLKAQVVHRKNLKYGESVMDLCYIYRLWSQMRHFVCVACCRLGRFYSGKVISGIGKACRSCFLAYSLNPDWIVSHPLSYSVRSQK